MIHHPREGGFGQALENEHAVVVAIEVETEIWFAEGGSFTIEAGVDDALLGIEVVVEIKVRQIGNGGIEEAIEFAEMTQVIERLDCPAKTAEDLVQEFFILTQFACAGIERVVVGRALAFAHGHASGIDLGGDIPMQPLTTQFALEHAIPVTREAFVARLLAPGVGGELVRLFVVVYNNSRR